MAYQTENNLIKAFGGESEANRRYLFFADKAEKEGYPQIARLFRAIAEAETVHARNHLNAIDAIGTTKDNLTAAEMLEYEEFNVMYPYYLEKANEERNDRAAMTFEWASKVERVHHDYFTSALEAIKQGEPPADETYYVCQVCGNTVTGKAPGKCPICGALGRAFVKVE